MVKHVITGTHKDIGSNPAISHMYVYMCAYRHIQTYMHIHAGVQLQSHPKELSLAFGTAVDVTARILVHNFL